MASDSNIPKLSTESSEEHFSFRIPPEAPVFEPTHEEFQDPLLYINKIRPIAEKTGICKIRPPSDWQPPFAVDIEKFKFTPRIQRLNELEAKTRIKLNFLDQIAKFWELQGSALKIPMVERRILDLYTLHQTVLGEGGATNTTKDRKWNKVAAKMGMPNNKGIGTLLRSHYERILYPFDVFQKSKSEGTNENKSGHSARAQMLEEDKGQNNIHKILQKTSSVERKSIRRSTTTVLDETKRTEFYGAGPKMAGFNLKKEEKQPTKTRGKRSFAEFDPLAKYVCRHCQRGDIEESMLLCDGCDDSYHTFCLVPPLLEIPKGDWRCPRCVAQEVDKPTEAFGFEQAQREYTLHQFGEMADQFKSDYFNMPVHRVPTSLVEREFWRIVSSLDEDVTVEYGADLHTIDHGSGFPTKTSPHVAESPVYAQYAESSWNLNNLPVLEGSVLAYINADISGMKVPWMYVGMCFATFCWHNEDHWSYSINYLHWGEPKTWYGVPGTSAEDFERSMKNAAPELFHSQPDLLHQLVTIMNPNVLMSAGVPVYRTDQHAGEFVITFPRAYHAGFNQGYNFAEAVNFAPADWLKMGRECISHYSSLHRYCVFSHDELVCKMAVHSESLDPRIAAATYQDMLQMVDQEKKLRKALLEWGVCDAEREAFELLPDDERQCEVCKTTCFLSAVTCSCSTSHLVCLRHHTYLCECPAKKHTLRYRYTLDELPIMLQKLKLKAESFDSWVLSVKDALDCTTPKSLDLDALKGLLREAEEKKFPESELLQALGLAIREADKCSTVARQLEANRVRTRARVIQECQLTMEELFLFQEQIEGLACRINEAASIKTWVNEVKITAEDLKRFIVSINPDLDEMESVIDKAIELNVRFVLLPKLQQKLVQIKWINAAEIALTKDNLTVEEIKDILCQYEEASYQLFPSHKCKLEDLRMKFEHLKVSVSEWESGTNSILEKSGSKTLEDCEKLLNDGKNMKVILPLLESLQPIASEGRKWTKDAREMLGSQFYPSFEAVKEIISRSSSIPLKLPLLKELEERLSKAQNWVEYTSSLFHNETSRASLMEILCPRVDERNNLQNNEDSNILKFQNYLMNIETENEVLLLTFNGAQREEINNMKKVQLHNIHKKLQASNLSQFCICLQKLSGKMVECSLCRDWFHEKCVTTLQEIKDKTDEYGCDIKFTCPYCKRTTRPSIEHILSLLLSLNKVGVRLPEGEALRFLMDRIVLWQSEVRDTLKNEEMVQALAVLEKRKKQKNNLEDQTVPKTNQEESSKVIRHSVSPISTKWAVTKPLNQKEDYLQSEHTYSSASKLTGIKKHNRKSPIIPRIYLDDEDDSIICLSKGGVLAIKELLNEGGLIEATLEETQLLWCLLQNSVPHQVWRDFGNEEVQKSLCELIPDNPDLKVKKKLPETDCTAPKRSKASTTKIGSDGNSSSPKKVKLIKKLNKIKGLKKKQKERKKDDEACAAPSCQKPKGTKVDWVQCDGTCDKWFHMRCVGILKKNLKTDDLYICPSCQSNKDKKVVRDKSKTVPSSNRPTILSRKIKGVQKKGLPSHKVKETGKKENSSRSSEFSGLQNKITVEEDRSKIQCTSGIKFSEVSGEL